MKNKEKTEWKFAKTSIFWGEIAPTDHVVQIYENDESFLITLEGFVLSGLEAKESVVLIATPEHITALSERLSKTGVDVDTNIADDHLIFLNAEQTLSKFMVNGWPEPKLFEETIMAIIRRALDKNRPVRAFGEMVALLWSKGEKSATVHLEMLWNRFCEMQNLCLFCAYPKNGFTQDVNSSAHTICCAHAKMLSGTQKSTTKIFYKTAPQQPSGIVL
ncbi:MEDS domain-containing protein [Sphingobacterium thalpophilum]|uniref:MEDS domain-containing protein n=1 Tax=Sphingobacterium thalpophilum TaxID=259 RepID=UPI0031DA0C97